MSGGRLCAVLGQLGFDAQDALDPDSFEWPFQYEEVRPLLDWICSSLRPSNVLSPSELSQYNLLLLLLFLLSSRYLSWNEGKLGITVLKKFQWFGLCIRYGWVIVSYEQFLHEGKLLEVGEDLDSAFDSISAFSSKKDNQEAVFGAEERLIDIR
ncbi:hypothetical protein BHE74_00034087 [Ensete ventricosum]|nr:hypothetical protein GW17_00041762 [Ensete ventricosum]RWW59003.1 hypothetical protein BHE74_00034087 [Ensete ventricosum]RZS11833.1 hypothetical protein BHM03_00043200 [Ensete ventricosum]